MKAERVQSVLALGRQLPGQWDEWKQAAVRFQQEDQALLHFAQTVQKQGGFSSQHELNQYNQRVKEHRENGQVLNRRLQHLNAYTQDLQHTLKLHEASPFHSGLLYPQEETRQEVNNAGNPLYHLLNQKILGVPVSPILSPEEGHRLLQTNRAGLQLSGDWPMLPALSKNPAQAGEEIREKNDLVRRLSSLIEPDFGRITGNGLIRRAEHPDGLKIDLQSPRAQAALANLTPWQQQLLRAGIAKGVIMEHRAAKPVVNAAVASMAAAGAAHVFGMAAEGSPLMAGLERLVGKLVATPLEERLVQMGVRPVVARVTTAAIPKLTSGAVGGGVGGSTAMGLATLAETGNAREALRAGLTSLPANMAFGAGGAGFAHATGAAAAHSRGLPIPEGGHVAPSAHASPLQSRAIRLRPDRVELPDGRAIDLNRIARPELERIANFLPAEHPAKVKIDAKLWGQRVPVGTAKVARPNGEVVSARHLSEPEVQQVLQDYTSLEQQGGLAPEQQQNKAAVEALAQHHEAYRGQQAVAMPLEAEGQQQAAWSKEKVLGRTHYNVVKGLADRVRETAPELAALLDQSLATMRGDQRRDFRQAYGAENGQPRQNTLAPPEQSVWRRLSEAERRVLPENVRRILMLQDIRNSGMVLKPEMPSAEFTKGMEKWSTAKLEQTANDLLVDAETTFGQNKPQVVEVGPQPAPAPAAEATPTTAPPAPPTDTSVGRMPTIDPATVQSALTPTPRPVEVPTPSVPKHGLHRESSLPTEPANVTVETDATRAVRAVADRGEASVLDLSQKLGLDVEEAKRLVQSLQKDGILGPETDQGTYRLAMERAKAEEWARARPDAYQARGEVAEAHLQAKAKGEMERGLTVEEQGRRSAGSRTPPSAAPPKRRPNRAGRPRWRRAAPPSRSQRPSRSPLPKRRRPRSTPVPSGAPTWSAARRSTA
jgi:hypothetical protein